MKALILVDIQNGLTKKKTLYNEKLFINSVNSAIKAFRNLKLKVVFIQHNNHQLKIGTYDWQIDDRIDRLENDIAIQKNHGNAFQNTDLKQILIDFNIDSIVIGGLVSHGCVKATCLGGLAEGFEIKLLRNGHTSWNKDAQAKIDDTETELLNAGIHTIEFS